MAKDSSGAKNQPIFSETGAPQLGTDLTLVSDYAAEVGNRKTGTTAERTALSGADRWVGLAFWDTDYGFEFVWDGSSWAEAPVYTDPAASIFTMESGWSLNNSQKVICGPIASIRMNVTRTGSTISGSTSGNITNVQVATVNVANMRPLNTIALPTDNTGVNCSFYLLADGGIWLAALPSGSINFATSDSASFSCTYIRNITA